MHQRAAYATSQGGVAHSEENTNCTLVSVTLIDCESNTVQDFQLQIAVDLFNIYFHKAG